MKILDLKACISSNFFIGYLAIFINPFQKSRKIAEIYNQCLTRLFMNIVNFLHLTNALFQLLLKLLADKNAWRTSKYSGVIFATCLSFAFTPLTIFPYNGFSFVTKQLFTKKICNITAGYKKNLCKCFSNLSLIFPWCTRVIMHQYFLLH